MKLLYLMAAWVGGLLLASLFGFPLWILIALFLGLTLLGGLMLFLKMPVAPVLLAALFLLGLMRSAPFDASPVFVPAEAGEMVRLEGIIVSDPEVRGPSIRFVLRTRSIDRGQGWQSLSEKVQVSSRPTLDLVTSRQDPFFFYGDRLLLEGRLDRPPVFQTFDYRDYLARQGIHLSMVSPKVELQAQDQGNPLLAIVYEFRSKMGRALSNSLPEPQASLAQALLLGQRGNFPADLRDDFRGTGTSHLLAISGLHVGVLLALSMGVGAYLLGRRGQFYLLAPLLTIWGYALLSGLSPSVLRAAIMGTVLLAALAVGRSRNVFPVLALAAGVMAGINPSILQNVSFQLSFAAVAGIALLTPPLMDWAQDRFYPVDGTRGTVHSLARGTLLAVAVSVAATIATLPLVAFNFQQVPTLGIPATLLALPALPFILGTSIFTVLAAFIHSSLGQAIGWIAWAPISYLVALVQLFALVPVSIITVPKFSGFFVWFYYGVLALIILAPQSFMSVAKGAVLGRVRRFGQALKAANTLRLSAALTFSLLAAVAWGQAVSSHDGLLHVIFLDVGQGDSVFIVTPQGQRILVDGGSDPTRAVHALNAHLPFWDRDLDLVVATHPDEDHMRGLIGVVQRHGVAAVVEGVTDSSPLYLQWRQAMNKKSLGPTSVYRGYAIRLDEAMSLQVLNPPIDPVARYFLDANNNSVVLRLAFGEVSFLLTGDIEQQTEMALLQGKEHLASTVLKVPHHGSRNSTSSSFLTAVDPKVAVVQAGSNNPYGHPHVEVVQRLESAIGKEHLYITANHGAVELITNGRSLWVKTHP